MALMRFSARPEASQGSPSSSSIALQRFPCYRTKNSATSEHLPNYESLDWADSPAAFEVTQIAQKKPGTRTRNKDPAIEMPAAAVTRTPTTNSGLTPEALAPAASRDIERGTVQLGKLPAKRSQSALTLMLCFVIGSGYICSDIVALKIIYPEDMSNIALNYYSVFRTSMFIQLGTLAGLALAMALLLIVAIIPKRQTLDRALSALAGACMCLMWALITSRVVLSAYGVFLSGMGRGEMVAYVYEKMKDSYLI